MENEIIKIVNKQAVKEDYNRTPSPGGFFLLASPTP